MRRFGSLSLCHQNDKMTIIRIRKKDTTNSCSHFPHPHRLIPRAGSGTPPVRRPRDGSHPISVTTMGGDDTAGNSIPDLYRFIQAPGGHAYSIRRPCHRDHAAYMTGIAIGSPSSGSIPQLNRSIIAGRSDMGATTRPR